MSTAEGEYGLIDRRHDDKRYTVSWSLEFMIMAGFSRATAAKLWDKWKKVERDLPCFFCDLDTAAKEWIEAAADVYNAHGPEDDYAAAGLAMGVDPDLLPQLLSDEHRPTRLLTSASSAFLASVEATTAHWYNMHSSSGADCPRPCQAQLEVDVPRSMDRHTMLYKAGTIFDLSRIWHPLYTNKVNLHALASKSPTDLSRTDTDMVYTFSQLEVAELSCSYQASFARHVPFAILHIAMPDYMLTLQNGFLPITDHKHWQRIVWESRGKKSFLEELEVT
jgi:hypothetical protein